MKEIELSIISSCIRNIEIDDIIDKIQIEDFFDPTCILVYKTILKLYTSNIIIDPIIIVQHLNDIEKRDWKKWVNILISKYIPKSIDGYIKKIKQNSKTIQIKNLTELAAAKIAKNIDIDKIITEIDTKITDITNDITSTTPILVKDLLAGTFENLEKAQKNGGVVGLQSGLTDLDKLTTGFYPGELIIIAGRPGMGKTSLLLTIATNMSDNTNKSNVIFSVEMPQLQLMQRLLAAEINVNIQKFRTGQLTKRELTLLGDASEKIQKLNLYIDDGGGLTLLNIKSKARKLQKKTQLNSIWIDYLQLMEGVGENRQNEIAKISRGLKELSKELQVPVIALSQLSRAVEQRQGDHRPQLSDLRESGAIEQDADVVIFCYRGIKYNKDDVDLIGIAELIVAKQRNGSTGSVKVAFNEEIAKFSNLIDTCDTF